MCSNSSREVPLPSTYSASTVDENPPPLSLSPPTVSTGGDAPTPTTTTTGKLKSTQTGMV